jgi:hypothetical protein
MRRRRQNLLRWTNSTVIMVRVSSSFRGACTLDLYLFLFLGNIFATNFTLGGELYSSRILTEDERSSLTKTKESVKAAAAFSISSPVVSAGGSFAKTNSQEAIASEQQLHQNLQLAWEARGGNTLLCSKYVVSWSYSVLSHVL